MAVETEDGPRISFSYNLRQPDQQTSPRPSPPRPTSTLPDDPEADFEFSVLKSSLDIEHSVADELFRDGEIVAAGVGTAFDFPARLQSREAVGTPANTPAQPPAPRAVAGRPPLARLVEVVDVQDERPTRRSFWRFGRSRSSSAASPNRSSPSLCFFPLMPRSYSSNSMTSSSKRSPSKTNNLSRENDRSKPSPPSSPKKKGFRSINGRRHGRVNPSSNVPLAPADTFGFGSLCLNRKCKNKP